jgi:signal transduction histidine kinase
VSRLRGLSERDWTVIDRLLLLMIAVVAVLDVLTSNVLEGPRLVNLVVLGATVSALVWRRSRPLLALAGVMGGLVGMQVFLTPPPDLFVAVLLLLAVNYSTAAHQEPRPALLGLALGAGTVLIVAAIYDPDDVFFPVAFFCVVPWLVGRTLRNQTMLARELAEKAEHAAHAREGEERRASAAERSRIARELHDVLAHNLSVMVVQASAARRIVDRQPDKAVEVAALIQRTGREALAEIRHLFGTVRRGEGDDLSGPPSITRVDGLARRARAAGLGVELRVVGKPVALPAGIDLTAYRIVQGALTNALKHAGSARAQVTVSYEPNEVVLSIEDDGEGSREGYELGEAGGGHGLVGMRERAALYGGLVHAGRRRGGGFAVHARLPTRPLVPGAELSRKVPA